VIDILSYLPAKRKQTPSGWISFNAVCCHYNVGSVDKRGRGGLKATDQGWSYHCFNCGYKATFILGRTLSFKARKLLSWMGVPDAEIDHLNLESIKHRNIHGILEDRQKTFTALNAIEFEERDLPPFAELLVDEDAYRNYVRNRGVPDDFPVMVQIQNDGVHWTRPHVVIPFTYDNKIVGYTCRFLDNKQPKFISDSQPGYVFGTDLQQPTWTQAIVVEGIFDALSIGGLAVMHNTINDAQSKLIRSLGKEITVVPDQDRAGLELVDRAVELGWAVSIPIWPVGIKDVNDAVIEMGRLGALLTIMQARETSRIKIELKRKQLAKRIQTSLRVGG
jgi:hypothetical protein